jgi:3-oxoacyl-[acyl-carrier protein] reductase
MFGDLDQRTWDAVHRDGLGATLAVSQACLVHLRATATEELSRTGRVAHQRRITNTVASAALTGSPGGAALSATGGAIAGLTRTLARELGGYGVNVNAVAVGFVETRLSAAQTAEDPATGVAESIRQMTKAMTALGRHGTPADVAAVHAFLASGDADFVTGAVIPVTGGLIGTL